MLTAAGSEGKVPAPTQRLGQRRHGYFEWLRAARLSQFLLAAAGICLCYGPALRAQTSDTQTGDANESGANKSWTVNTESQSRNLNPTRTLKTHVQSGNRTVDNQSIQRRGANGDFEPYQDIEKTTLQVNATTVRTTTRTFGRDADGAKTLVQVTEEEARTVPGGGSNVVRSTSNPDANGKLQLVQREIAETKRIGKDVEETKTTVMLPNINGGLAPAMMTQERQERRANDTVVSQKTTQLADGAGKWQVGEVRQTTSRQEGKERTTEERVSRPDPNGKLGEISRTVRKDSENAPGEKHDTVETYSVDVPGAPRDGSLHLVERATTAQSTRSTGQQTTARQVEKADPGDPGSGLRVSIVTTDTVRPSSTGAQATQTIQLRNSNGDFEVVSVDTKKSDNAHAVQVQIAPAAKPIAPAEKSK
jgi:hypothetical protein